MEDIEHARALAQQHAEEQQALATALELECEKQEKEQRALEQDGLVFPEHDPPACHRICREYLIAAVDRLVATGIDLYFVKFAVEAMGTHVNKLVEQERNRRRNGDARAAANLRP